MLSEPEVGQVVMQVMDGLFNAGHSDEFVQLQKEDQNLSEIRKYLTDGTLPAGKTDDT